MILTLRHLNVRSFDALDSWVERHIFSLAEACQIDEADVRLIRLEDANPAYLVQVHLVKPGPDVFAESRDHTLRAAFAKAVRQLRKTITGRATKRMQKLKCNVKARHRALAGLRLTRQPNQTMKAKTILRSLADLSADLLASGASAPRQAMNVSRQMLGAGVQATRREIRAARRRSAEFARGIYARAHAPFRCTQPWLRGGLNE